MPFWKKNEGGLKSSTCTLCGAGLLKRQEALDRAPSGPFIGSGAELMDKLSAVNRTGYQCTGCGKLFCLNCMEQKAPPYPGGGKACPLCGASIGYWHG